MFATKDERHVRVFALDLRSGSCDEILAYDERHLADPGSGNYYGLLLPSIAMSPDGGLVVYAAADGLFTFDPAAGDQATLIERIEEGSDARPGRWKPKLKEVFSIVAPTVSPDGRYVSFEQGHYEGGALGLMGITGAPFETELVRALHPESTSNVSWAAQANRWVVSRRGFSMKPGLFVSDPSDVTRSEFIGLDGDVEILDAALSPDGMRATFVSGPREAKADTVWLVDADGSRRRAIDRNGIKGDAFFDPAGDLWWIENDRRARRLHHRADEIVVNDLDSAYTWSFVGWFDGKLALTGSLEGPRSGHRLVLLDPGSFTELESYESPSVAVAFLGPAQVTLPAA